MRRTALIVAIVVFAAPDARSATTVENGYEVTKSQSITPAPHGYVGRKTTDRETRTGVVPDETWGNSSEFVMTLGGWAKRCPDNAGMVPGHFEYVLTQNQTISDEAGTRRTSYSHRLIARLQGKVADDARLEYVEIEAEFSRTQDGRSTEFTALPPTRFSPGSGGEPDWEAMRRTVEMTANLSFATAILMMGTQFKVAEGEWMKVATRCVEVTFDPPTDSRALGSEEKIEVQPRVRSAGESGAIVSEWGPFSASVKNGGHIAPPRDSSAISIPPPVIKYTAAAQPRQGHGFTIVMKTRAGVGEGEWRIVDPGFEGRFTYTDSAKLGIANDLLRITGRLVWTPDNRPASPTFGEHKSLFFRPTDGEITVELDQESRGMDGMSKCKTTGSRTFPLASLGPGALRYMQLEIADDGRYKLTFVIPDNPDPFPPWDADSVCTFPNVSRSIAVPVKYIGLVLGLQQGRVDSEQAVVGQTQAPIRRGPREVTGSWSFKRLGGNR